MAARTSVFPANSYSPPEESSFNEDVIVVVEKSMKKYSDNLLRFLEGISSRLSQVELYCYNMDKSLGEIRVDLVRYNGEADSKLKSLQKHLQEVHRSVEILRDKQELADTHKELAKLKLLQKESASSDADENENSSDTSGQKLALVLPHQVQSQAYYLPQPKLQNAPYSQGPYLPPDGQYLVSQMQELPRLQSSQSQVIPPPQVQTMPQWTTQLPQQVQPQLRPSSSPSVYPSETVPGNVQMQVPYSGISQPGSEAIPYGYGGAVRPVQPQPPTPQIKASFSLQGRPHPTHSPGNPYVMYDETGRPHPPQFQQSAYRPTSLPPQNLQPATGSNIVGARSQFVRNHPYNEVMEKLVSMGYRGDHVVGVIQRLQETGQPVDFNTVLDRLNGHSSVGPLRAWSG